MWAKEAKELKILEGKPIWPAVEDKLYFLYDGYTDWVPAAIIKQT